MTITRNICARNEDVFIKSKEILPDVFIGTTLSSIKDNYLPILVLNSTLEDINLGKFIPENYNLKHFEVID